MKRLMNRLPSPAMVVACIALAVALGGTSYAAIKLPRNSVGNIQLKRNAVSNPKIRNNAVNGAKVANNSIRGADVLESSLAKVPSAANADQATNATTIGGAGIDSLTIGRGTASTTGGGTSSSCDPSSSAFIDCGNVALTLPRSGRVLMVADAAFHGVNTLAYRGDCQLVVDGARIGAVLSAGSVHVDAGADGDISGSGFNANTQNGIGLNAVTDVLAAGAHTFALQCNQAGGTIEFPETFVSAVMIGTA